MWLLDMMPATHRGEVDGVPVLWALRGECYTGSLTCAVGRSDETFIHGGITHLVERLAMSAVAALALVEGDHHGHAPAVMRR